MIFARSRRKFSKRPRVFWCWFVFFSKEWSCVDEWKTRVVFFLERVSFIRILSSNRRLNLVRLPACTSKQIYFLVTFVRKEKSGFDREGME